MAEMTALRLLHHSSELFEGPVVSRDQRAAPRPPTYKPWGFWVSVDGPDSWREWCEAQEWNLDAFEYTAEVELADAANILTLSSEADLWSFHREYAAIDDLRISEYPDWVRVADEYDGIIIAPYQWGCRLDGRVSDWYYWWDCASGCIWNADAIASIRATPTDDPGGTDG